MQTAAAVVENSMEFLQKTKNGLPFALAIPLLAVYPKEPWKTNPKEPMHPNIRSSIIYNKQVLEIA